MLADDDGNLAALHGLDERGILVLLSAPVCGIVLVNDDDVGGERVEVSNQAGQEGARSACVENQIGRIGLGIDVDDRNARSGGVAQRPAGKRQIHPGRYAALIDIDRKSTRLNSSHLGISYAV